MKLPRFKRKFAVPALCLLGAAVMFGAVNLPGVVSAAATSRQLPIYCVQRDQKMVSLSFDAAWGEVRVRPLSAGQPVSRSVCRRVLIHWTGPYDREVLL